MERGPERCSSQYRVSFAPATWPTRCIPEFSTKDPSPHQITWASSLGLNQGDTANEQVNSPPFNTLERAVFRTNKRTTITEIADGASNTMMVAEYLTGIEDFGNGMGREMFLTTRPSCQLLHVSQTPNSTSPEILWENKDGCGDPSDNRPAAICRAFRVDKTRTLPQPAAGTRATSTRSSPTVAFTSSKTASTSVHGTPWAGWPMVQYPATIRIGTSDWSGLTCSLNSKNKSTRCHRLTAGCHKSGRGELNPRPHAP
jgi:hypothetical protein